MSSTTYYNSLPATVYDGTIGSIRLRWSTAGRDRVYTLSQETGAPLETIKALTEHVVYASAYRLQNQQAVIRAPPHDFSIDSKTGAQHMDGIHVSCELSGGSGGRSVTHIYLAGVGQGAEAYDNVHMTGESVTKKKGGKTALDPNLSIGNYSTGKFQTTATTAVGSASGHAGSSSSGATGQSEWVWYEEYTRGGITLGLSSGSSKRASESRELVHLMKRLREAFLTGDILWSYNLTPISLCGYLEEIYIDF